MNTRRNGQLVGALATVFLAAALGGTAKAETGGYRPTLSIDAGFMHSEAVRQLGTDIDYASAPNAMGAIPYVGLAGWWGRGWWLAGVRADLAHDLIFGRSEVFATAFSGGRLNLGTWQLQATAEVGGHLLRSIGNGIFLEPSNADAAMPFAGARLEIGHSTGEHHGRVGLSAFVREDLTRQPLTTTVFSDGTFEKFTYHASYDLGGRTVGVALNVSTN